MYTLVLEASTVAGSVALLRDEIVVQQRDVLMGASREDALFPAVQSALGDEGLSVSALSAIVCGEGPGSFTSLRIAASIAKGLAQAAHVSLFAVPSLLLSAAACEEPGDYVVHADALRGERYAMLVRIDDHGQVHGEGSVVRVNADALDTFAGTRQRLRVLSTASEGAAAESERMVRPSAAALPNIAHWRARGRVSLADWEPAYGRLAEAQVKWEATHQRPLTDGASASGESATGEPATGDSA